MADITGYRWRVWADTAATLTTQNPTLLSGEIVKESDTGKIKIGDGSTAWSNLPYYVPAGNASYNFTIDTTSSAVAMTASVSWVYSDGFTGTTYPSVLNTTLSDGDIVTFKNTGATGNNVTGLPDDRPLLDGEIISYIFVDGSYSNISEQPHIVRAEYSVIATVEAYNNLRWTTEVEDTHTAYDSATGIFTAPIAGVYQLSGSIRSSIIGKGDIDILKNSTAYFRCNTHYIGVADPAAMPFYASLRLSKGDEVTIQTGKSITTSPSSVYRIMIERIGN